MTHVVVDLKKKGKFLFFQLPKTRGTGKKKMSKAKNVKLPRSQFINTLEFKLHSERTNKKKNTNLESSVERRNRPKERTSTKKTN